MESEIKPLAWQPAAIAVIAKAMKERRSVLDASDMGTGKTFHVLFAAREAKMRLAVVCPIAVIPTWKEAAAKIGVEMEFVRNVESLKAEKPTKYLRQRIDRMWEWRKMDNTALVFDEVHRFAGSNTQNGRILCSAPRPVIMLSGTAAQSPIQMRGIGSQLGLTTWAQWWKWCLMNGCRPGTFGGLEFVAPFVLERLHKQIFESGRGVRVRIKDLKGLFPEHQVQAMAVPVDGAAALDKSYIEELKELSDEAETKPGSQIVKLLRSRQMSEHLKLPAAMSIAGDALEQGKSVVIFVNFRDSLDWLGSHDWGHRCVLIHGDQDAEEREAQRREFHEDRARVMVAMIQAGGIALSAHDIRGEFPREQILFPGWSARDILQALHRCVRAEAKSNVISHILFAAGTVEEQVRARVNLNHRAIETLNDGAITDADLIPADHGKHDDNPDPRPHDNPDTRPRRVLTLETEDAGDFTGFRTGFGR